MGSEVSRLADLLTAPIARPGGAIGGHTPGRDAGFFQHRYCDLACDVVQPALESPVRLDVQLRSKLDGKPVVGTDHRCGLAYDVGFFLSQPSPRGCHRLLGQRRPGAGQHVETASFERRCQLGYFVGGPGIVLEDGAAGALRRACPAARRPAPYRCTPPL